MNSLLNKRLLHVARELTSMAERTGRKRKVAANTLSKVQEVYRTYKALQLAVTDLANTWSSDVEYRNRPNRQKLTTELTALINANLTMDVGDVLSRIEDELS